MALRKSANRGFCLSSKTAAYDQKEGFLRSFRSDELGAIRTVKQRSIVSHPEYTAGYIDAAGVDLPYNTTIDTVADGYDSAHYEYIWDRAFSAGCSAAQNG